MFDIFKKIFFAYKIMKVHSLHEKKAYEEGIEVLKSIGSSYDKIKCDFPEYYLLLGELLAEKNIIKESFDCFTRALNCILDANTINEDEKRYLSLFASRWLTYLATQDKNLELPDFGSNISARTDFNYYNVSTSIKRYFPLLHSSGFEKGTKTPKK